MCNSPFYVSEERPYSTGSYCRNRSSMAFKGALW